MTLRQNIIQLIANYIFTIIYIVLNYKCMHECVITCYYYEIVYDLAMVGVAKGLNPPLKFHENFKIFLVYCERTT